MSFGKTDFKFNSGNSAQYLILETNSSGDLTLRFRGLRFLTASPLFTSNTTACAYRVFNLINSYPTTGASYPIVTQPMVNWGVGSRYTDYVALTTTTNGSITLVNPTYGAVIFTTVSTRFPSADLKTQTYGMLPVSWRHLYYYNAGGDASAKGGWYCFNGDYYPSDEFSYSGKTYKILPTWTGYSNRVGIAIPKE